MHHGTCVTHVPWCMPGSLTRGFLRISAAGENVPGVCVTLNFTYLVRGPCMLAQSWLCRAYGAQHWHEQTLPWSQFSRVHVGPTSGQSQLGDILQQGFIMGPVLRFQQMTQNIACVSKDFSTSLRHWPRQCWIKVWSKTENEPWTALMSEWGISSGSRSFVTNLIPYHRDHSVCAPSQWVTALHRNTVSHWLGAFTEWSMLSCYQLSSTHLKSYSDWT